MNIPPNLPPGQPCSIERDMAEFIAAHFTPEWREIDRLKERIEKLPPRAYCRVVLQHELCELVARQIRRELAA